jgi:hypothetical protein
MQEPEGAAPEPEREAPSPPPTPVPRARRRGGPVDPSKPPPLDLTRVLSLTFSTFFRNFHRLLLISLVVFAPVLLLGGILYGVAGVGESSTGITLLLLALDLLVLNHLLTAALVQGIGQDIRRGGMSVSRALQAAFGRTLPVIVLGNLLLGGLLFGFALLVLPGLILMCIWCAAFPAMMEEEVGPLEAIRRSAKLTKGSRLPIFSVLAILLLAIYTLSSITLMPVAIFFERGGGGVVLFLMAQSLLVLGRVILAVLSAVIYHELRVGGEGLELEELSAVFE